MYICSSSHARQCLYYLQSSSCRNGIAFPFPLSLSNEPDVRELLDLDARNASESCRSRSRPAMNRTGSDRFLYCNSSCSDEEHRRSCSCALHWCRLRLSDSARLTIVSGVNFRCPLEPGQRIVVSLATLARDIMTLAPPFGENQNHNRNGITTLIKITAIKIEWCQLERRRNYFPWKTSAAIA